MGDFGTSNKVVDYSYVLRKSGAHNASNDCFTKKLKLLVYFQKPIKVPQLASPAGGVGLINLVTALIINYVIDDHFEAKMCAAP